ncbi:hypothetical protein BH09PLA1_BH09PLA1_02620 [soil metagenome]
MAAAVIVGFRGVDGVSTIGVIGGERKLIASPRPFQPGGLKGRSSGMI